MPARILLVEDNELNRDMLSRRLARKGYEVGIAPDGRQGLDQARSGRFDLVLMDLSLPEIDGWEVARRLKEDPRTRATPIIALTAHAMAGDRDRAIEAGVDDYDTKPVDFARLLGKINALLRPNPNPPGGPMRIDDPERAAVLRHDLVAPLNRILGYSELMLDDARSTGLDGRVARLDAIRALGRQVLEAIDLALLRRPDGPGRNDLALLAPGVIGPSRAIIDACQTLEQEVARTPAPAPPSFLEDLANVRQDSALLIEMASRVAETPSASG